MRFHCGISFSWRTIKKFLFPFLLGLLAYLGFTTIFDHFDLSNLHLGSLKLFSPLEVEAYTNQSTNFNITVPDYKTDLESHICGNTNLYDFINDFISSIDFSTSYYQIFVSKRFDSNANYNLYMYLIPTTTLSGLYGNQMWVRGRYVSNTSPYNRFELYGAVSFQAEVGFKFTGCSSSLDVMNSTWVQNLKNKIISNDNTILNNTTDINIGHYGNGTGNYDIMYQISSSSSNQFNNNSSYNIPIWYYYNSYDIYYPAYSVIQNSSAYWKNVHLVNENIDFTYGDKFLGYYDLYPPEQPEPTFLGYGDSLKTFYTNLSPSNINSYSLKVNFNVPQSLLGYYQLPQEYVDNTSFNYICSGRIDNSNYYSYESFPCSLTSSYTLTDSSVEYTFNTFSTSQVLSTYDRLYITIQPIYLDSNINTTIFNLSYTYTIGNFFNTDFKGAIYENFHNLPLNFSMYFSSNNSIVNSDLYVRYYDFIDYGLHFIGFSNISNQQNLVIGSSILGTSADSNFDSNFIRTSVSNSFDTGIMIYQQNSSVNLMNLDLFFNSGMYISINNSSDQFYYIDKNGDIQSADFVKPTSSDINDYNISSYVNVITDFIDDLSSSSYQLSIYTQILYNGLPVFIQTLIFVLFILSNIYFIYLLIRK